MRKGLQAVCDALVADFTNFVRTQMPDIESSLAGSESQGTGTFTFTAKENADDTYTIQTKGRLSKPWTGQKHLAKLTNGQLSLWTGAPPSKEDGANGERRETTAPPPA